MKPLYLLIAVLLMSCGNEKLVQLPVITGAEITELRDVSPAYLFYDETKVDSIELNRKNLISTTHWLVNVDKRLTLKQAIPKIVFLQNKKRNAEVHKNENAKNYYTCNDTSIQNLGFIDFTDVIYHEESSDQFYSKTADSEDNNPLITLNIHSVEHIEISSNTNHFNPIESTIKSLMNSITNLQVVSETKLILNFKKSITFQDYITVKSVLSTLNDKNIEIENNEFIY